MLLTTTVILVFDGPHTAQESVCLTSPLAKVISLTRGTHCSCNHDNNWSCAAKSPVYATSGDWEGGKGGGGGRRRGRGGGCVHREKKATYIKEEMHDHIFFLNHFWFSSTHSFFAECYLRLVFLSVGETRGGGVTAGVCVREEGCVVCV